MSDAERQMVRAAVVVAVPVELPSDPSWERARALKESIERVTAEGIIALGLELSALRRQWFAAGQGGGRPWEKITSGQGCPEVMKRVHHSVVVGWRKRVEEELDISYKTAERLIQKADQVIRLKALSEGEGVEYIDSRKALRRIEEPVPPEMRELAAAALDEVVLGTVNASRAFAGVVGEAERRVGGAGGATANRAEPDYRRKVGPAAVTLKGAFQRWARLEWDEEGEHEAENAVCGALNAMPDRVRALMVEIIIDGWKAHEKADLAARLAADLKKRRG
jgi:hypothetical protein